MNRTIRRWRLTFAAAMGAFALIRPLMSVTGLSERIGQPFVSLGATVLITLVWIAAANLARVERPVPALMMAGIAYGVFAIVLSGVLSPLVTGRLQGPLTNPFGFAGVLVTNAVWGIAAGLLAAAVQRALRRAANIIPRKKSSSESRADGLSGIRRGFLEITRFPRACGRG